MPREDVAARLRTMIAARGVKQSWLASEAGIPAETLSRILTRTTGNPGVYTLQKIATALGATVGGILGEQQSSAFRGIDKERAKTFVTWMTEVFQLAETTQPVLSSNTDKLNANVLRLPERTAPRWTPEFPIAPAEFNDNGDTDYPLELHGYELEDIDAAAGEWGVDNDDMTTVLNSKEVRDAAIRTVRVRGDSMAPTFEEGWKLAVDVTRTPENGDAVIVYRQDAGTVIARWLSNGAHTWLMKDNTEEAEDGKRLHPDIEMKKGDMLIGVVSYVAWQPVRRVAALTMRMPKKGPRRA